MLCIPAIGRNNEPGFGPGNELQERIGQGVLRTQERAHLLICRRNSNFSQRIDRLKTNRSGHFVPSGLPQSPAQRRKDLIDFGRG